MFPCREKKRYRVPEIPAWHGNEFYWWCETVPDPWDFMPVYRADECFIFT